MCNGRKLTTKEYIAALERVLEEFNVEDYEITQNGKKHPYVVFELNGREMRHSLPATPSDRRGPLAFRTMLRRACRLQQAAGTA